MLVLSRSGSIKAALSVEQIWRIFGDIFSDNLAYFSIKTYVVGAY